MDVDSDSYSPSERAFRATGPYLQANPSYQDWLAMHH